jgi:hypothetical protein
VGKHTGVCVRWCWTVLPAYFAGTARNNPSFSPFPFSMSYDSRIPAPIQEGLPLLLKLLWHSRMIKLSVSVNNGHFQAMVINA